MSQNVLWRALQMVLLIGLIAACLAACNASTGQRCANDSDCEPGFECVSTGGVAFGDRICLVSAEAPSDAASGQGDAADTAATDAQNPGDAQNDAQEDANGAGDAQNDAQDSDTGDASPAESDAEDTSADQPCDFGGMSAGVCADGLTDEDGTCQPPSTYSATEICDGAFDNNCDGQVDEGCACQNGQTQSCGSSTGACESGVQTCSNGSWGSCQGAAGPSQETCDGVDNDCDGDVDDGVQMEYYRDEDLDGFGDGGDSQELCAPAGTYTASVAGDCDDTNPDINPNAAERCTLSADYDCDGQPTCADSDCDNRQCVGPGLTLGTCQNNLCVSQSGECTRDSDCGFDQYCQQCSGGDVCCPDNHICPCAAQE